MPILTSLNSLVGMLPLGFLQRCSWQAESLQKQLSQVHLQIPAAGSAWRFRHSDTRAFDGSIYIVSLESWALLSDGHKSQIQTRSTAYEQCQVEAKEENTNSKERCCFFRPMPFRYLVVDFQRDDSDDLQDLTESDELLRKKKTLREAPWPSEDRTPKAFCQQSILPAKHSASKALHDPVSHTLVAPLDRTNPYTNSNFEAVRVAEFARTLELEGAPHSSPHVP